MKYGKTCLTQSSRKNRPKHAAILVTRAAGKMTEDQQQLFNRIMLQCPEVLNLRQLALGFRDALQADESIQMLRWIERAKHCAFGQIVRFAYGLQKDISAVAAAVDTPWSTCTRFDLNSCKA